MRERRSENAGSLPVLRALLLRKYNLTEIIGSCCGNFRTHQVGREAAAGSTPEVNLRS